jgi:hypothetical protein
LVSEGAVAVAHLIPGALPAPDWSRLLLDAHEEGYGAVRAIARSPADRGDCAGTVDAILPPSAALAVPARRPRAGELRGPSVLRGGRRPLRGPSGRQTSVAIRSSERLKTAAPTASATTAARTV